MSKKPLKKSKIPPATVAFIPEERHEEENKKSNKSIHTATVALIPRPSSSSSSSAASNAGSTPHACAVAIAEDEEFADEDTPSTQLLEETQSNRESVPVNRGNEGSSSSMVPEGFVLMSKRDLRNRWIISILCVVIALLLGTMVAGVFVGGWSLVMNKNDSDDLATQSNADTIENGPILSSTASTVETVTDSPSILASNFPSAPPSDLVSFVPTVSPSVYSTTASSMSQSEYLMSIIAPTSSKEVITDEASPQYQAFQWLLSQQLPEKYSDDKIIQRYILTTLYFSTWGTAWTQANNWTTDQDECNWSGIVCDTTTGIHSKVSTINLSGFGLVGKIPPELGHLTNLQLLWLSSNSLSGSIPSNLFQLKNLSGLALNENDLSSTIPANIEKLISLEHLDLSLNNIEGEIPNSIGNIQYLHEINLSHNSLSGEIPLPLLSNLDFLEMLILDKNAIEGTIPQMIGELQYLKTLSLSDNLLFDEIPESICKMTGLETLNLDENALSGHVPACLDQLDNLQELRLEKNNLNGEMLLGQVTKYILFVPSTSCELMLNVMTADCGGGDPEVYCPCCTGCYTS